MIVSGLFVYPVKSLRGCALEGSPVGLRGLRWDRHWMIVDENGRFRTQRQIPKMAQVGTELGESLVLTHREARIEVPWTSQGGTVEGTVWNWTGPVDLVDPHVDRWLTEVLEMPCRLVVMREDAQRNGWGDGPIAFPDGAAVLVAGEASLTDLNARLEDPVPMDRFRANLILAGSAPYAEDEWTGLKIGGVQMNFAKRCGRCLVTTADQMTGVRHPGEEPLRTLVRERKFGNSACFGAYYAPQGEGTIVVGDRIEAQ